MPGRRQVRIQTVLICPYGFLDFSSTQKRLSLLADHKGRPRERPLLYLFEDYALDTDRRELRRGGRLIPVEPQVFDLLEHLICNRERVVSKDDLIASIWGGRIVSESALGTRINAARTAIGDSGEAQRLIKTLPRKGIRFVGVVREERRSKPPPALPDKPSIAVLPFLNMSGDPEQEYFADGIVEEIITALSRMRWLFVIASNSSFTYKGRAVDVKQVGRELGVRYVLEGGVRKAGNRVRITAQLIDPSTGAHLWADRFEGELNNIFDLQDQVTASVVGAIAPKLQQAEVERAKRKPTESLHAYDYLLRGMANLRLWTREANDEALRLFNKAIELDPDFSSAYGMATWCYALQNSMRWMANRVQDIAETARLARRAAEVGWDDADASARAGFALAYVVHDVDAGAALVDRALVLNPNLAEAWHFSGWVKVYLGEPETAVEHFAHAMRLSPLDPINFVAQTGTALAHFFAGRNDDASSWAEKALRQTPDFLPALRVAAASNALAGRMEEARSAIARSLWLYPTPHLSNLKNQIPLRRADDLSRYAEGLRKAGLPE
jgi:TolB-like protein/Flp pilus assembly protein TadD